MRYLVLFALTVILATARPALADARAEARRHFRAGMALVQAGELAAGVAELRAAYELLPHPNVLYNIGRAYRDAGQPDKALPYFEQYLASDPPDRARVEEMARKVRDLVASRRPPGLPAQGAAGDGAPAAGALFPESGTSGAATLETTTVPTATATIDVRAIEATAAQLEALAKASDSDVLRRRAAALRELVLALRQGADLRLSASGGIDPRTVVTTAPEKGSGTAVRPPTTPGSAGSVDKHEGVPSNVPRGASSKQTTATASRDDPPPAMGGDIYAEKIVSASRFAQSPLDAPNSTTIVTTQDIRLTGLTNLADLLRRVAGVEVMTLTPGASEVSVRGLNQRLSNKVLVLVDGRSVYLDFLGMTLWRALPLAVEDIDRIEIIRGPASALYGADAFTGVIHVITRDPAGAASFVSAATGEGAFARAVASFMGRRERLSYRLEAGYEQENHHSLEADPERLDVLQLSGTPDRGLARLSFGGRLQYRLGDGYRFDAGVAGSRSDLTLVAIGRLRQVALRDSLFTQSHVALTTPAGLRLRAHWTLLQTDVNQPYAAPGALPLVAQDTRSQSIDTEIEYTGRLQLGIEHKITLGAGYRFKSIRWSWLDGEHVQHQLSAFAQDTLELGELVRLVASARIDRHPLLGAVQFSPRGSVVVRPTATTALRGTVGSAYRLPTMLESYLAFANQTPVRGVTAFGIGNRDLEPERILSIEVGYSHQASDYVAFEANAYYNLVDDQILLSRIQPYRLDDYPGYDEAHRAFPLGELQFSNEDATFRQIGGELGIRVYPVAGVDLYANYSYHDTRPADPDVHLGGREHDQRTSAHKMNAGLQYRTPFGFDLGADLHLVSAQRWVEQVTDTATGVRFEGFELPRYARVDARLGYRFGPFEAALVGTNLIGPPHREHPFGQRLGRRVWVSLATRL